MSILDNALYETDCLSLIERIPDEAIDLIYIDCLGSDLALQWQRKGGEEIYGRFITKLIRQCKRMLSHTGNLFIHDNPYDNGSLKQLLYRAFPSGYQPEIVVPLNRKYPAKRISREMILHCTKSYENTRNDLIIPMPESKIMREIYSRQDENGLFSLAPLATPLFSREQRPNLFFEFKGHLPKQGYTWRYTLERLRELEEDGHIYQPSLDQFPRLKQYLKDRKINVTYDWEDVSADVSLNKFSASHLIERPLELFDRLILIYSNQNDIILNPYCSAGSALVSASNNGRRWIGCDASEDAIRVSKERLQEKCGLLPNNDFLVGNKSHLVANYETVRSSMYPKYFISYSSQDRDEFILPFCDILHDQDIDYWLDKRDIEIGQEWRVRLSEGLQKCEAMILFISPDALSSPYVQEEYQAFLKSGKPIYQLLCRDTYVPPELSELQYYPFSEYPKLVELLLKLSL